MRFAQLEALDKMIDESSLADVLCDLETICQARAQSHWDVGHRNEFSRWDQHSITLSVACEFMKRTDKERDSRE